ncbi:hypothetical protein DYB31_016549, partial [Aphanomyces astaci]
MLAPIHAGPTSPVEGNAVQAGGTTARNPPEPSITAPPPHGSPCPLVGGGLDLPTSSGPPLSASSSVSSITSGRSGKHLVEGSGAAPVVGIQPMPPTESKDSRPKGRATIALGSVLAPLAQRSNEPALAIATNAKNMMPFNSNAAPIKPPPESVVAKKRVSRHGSVLTGTDEPSNYDLEMMKMLVNRENYGTGSIKEEKRSKDSLRTDTSESTLLPNASSVMNVIKASSSKSGNDDSFKLVAQRRSSHDGLAGAEPANSGNMLNHVRSNEMEFMAEQELISIMPYFELQENGGRLNGISGDFGPFHPSTPTQVPLWLALSLKQLQKCRILQPSWFTVAHLKDRLDKETSSELFEELPFHYLE